MTSSHEGAEVVYWIQGMTDPIVNYHLKPETYERAFKEAGFSEFQWERVLLAPSEQGSSFWDEFFNDEPPMIAMSGKK